MSSQLDMGALSMDAPAAPAALDAPTRQKLAGFIEEACGVHVDSDEETDEHSDNPNPITEIRIQNLEKGLDVCTKKIMEYQFKLDGDGMCVGGVPKAFVMCCRSKLSNESGNVLHEMYQTALNDAKFLRTVEKLIPVRYMYVC